MKPTEILMNDHRVIERMLALLEKMKSVMIETGELDKFFVDRAVDFFETFVDGSHHGKEEKILFNRFSAKSLYPELNRTIAHLISEHVHTREALREFRQTSYSCRNDQKLLEASVKLFETLIKLYPDHIEDEEKHFFPQSMEHLNEEEQKEMLENFKDFDKTFVHSKYEGLISGLEGLAPR